MRTINPLTLKSIYQVLKDKNINLVEKGYPKIKSNLIEHPCYLSYENTFKLLKFGIQPVNIDAYWHWNNYPNPYTIPVIRVNKTKQSICPLFRKEEFANYTRDMQKYYVKEEDVFVVYKKSSGKLFLAVAPVLEDAEVKVLERMFEYENDLEYWAEEWFDSPESM
jgi:hypothetical protein